MFGRALCDFAFAVVLLGLPVSRYEVEESKFCSRFGNLAIMFYSASQAYFVGFAVNIYVTLTKPLQAPSKTSKQIHMGVWLYAVACMVVASLQRVKVFVWDSGENGEKVCHYRGGFKQVSLYFILVPFAVGIGAGLVSAVFAYAELKSGLAESYLLRMYAYSIRIH